MKNKTDTLSAWSRKGRGPKAPARWYYLTRTAANGEALTTTRYRTRGGRNQALRRALNNEPGLRVERLGPKA
jgi:hypothetical protein